MQSCKNSAINNKMILLLMRAFATGTTNGVQDKDAEQEWRLPTGEDNSENAFDMENI